ncbi:MAG: hypothetical protein RW306_19650 [Geobacteraceae bacterium]|nr:hypothetical protein [Geobacteraceae bacterium]
MSENMKKKFHFSKSLLFDAHRLLFGKCDNAAHAIQVFSAAELKTAHRIAAKATHPDLNHALHNELLNTNFRKVTEAYNLLNDFLLARDSAQVSAEHFNEQICKHKKPQWAPKTHTYRPAATRMYRERESFSKKPKVESHRYYEGMMPTIALKTGLFLYYSGKISYEQMIEALVWQRNMRPPIGELAAHWNWLHKSFIDIILKEVSRGGQFGERAVSMGLLKESQVKVLLRHQLFMQKPVGSYFVSNKILTREELKESLLVMSIHNKLFAEERKAREQRLLEFSERQRK